MTEEQWECSLTDAAWGFLFSEPNLSIRVVLLGRHKREKKKNQRRMYRSPKNSTERLRRPDWMLEVVNTACWHVGEGLGNSGFSL